MSRTRKELRQVSARTRGGVRFGRQTVRGVLRNLLFKGKTFPQIIQTVEKFIQEIGLYINEFGQMTHYKFLGKPGLKIYQGRAQSLTISSGEIEVKPVVGTGLGIYTLEVDTEASASTDDLDTITLVPAREGNLVTLRPADSSRTVVVKDSTGNLDMQAGDHTMSNVDHVSTFLQLSDGSFVQITRS